ncbi:MAG: hypothetical protein RL721_632 [Candidatus Eisenbacteria bacterium]
MKATLPNELRVRAAPSVPPISEPTRRVSAPTGDGLAGAPPSNPPERQRPRSTGLLARTRHAGAAVAFAAVTLLMRAAVHVYFAHVIVRHRHRFPATGPVLVVANHPAMWTDVLVLDVALGRKLHFLAQGALFRPHLRGALLRLHGALPVTPTHETPDATARNAGTFRVCGDLFARGEVVAVFPEGVSRADRTVLDLRPGAARLALQQALCSSAHEVPVVLPVGLHYADRKAFGSTVTVSVGPAEDLAPYLTLARTDPEGAARALTGRLHRALRALILDLPEPTLAAAVSVLEPIAALDTGGGTWELASARRVAARLAQLRAVAPRGFQSFGSHVRAYRRARAALGLDDRAIHGNRHSASWRQRTWSLVPFVGLGAPVAAVGAVLHLVPWAIGEWTAHRVGRDPVRFSFARISSGMVLYPALYAVLGVSAVHNGWLGTAQLPLLFVAFAGLGLFTLRYASALHALAGRARLAWIEWRHPRLVARARREQHALLDALCTLQDDDLPPEGVPS